MELPWAQMEPAQIVSSNSAPYAALSGLPNTGVLQMPGLCPGTCETCLAHTKLASKCSLQDAQIFRHTCGKIYLKMYGIFFS